LLFGDVWLPNEPTSYKTYLYSPPKIYAYRQGKHSGEEPARELIAPQEVKVVLQKLYDQGITIEVRYGLVTLRSAQTYCTQGYNIQTYLASIQNQYEAVAQLARLVQQYNREIIQALTSEGEWRHEFYGQMLSAGLAWAECSACGDVSLLPHADDLDDEEDVRHQRCPQKEHGWYCHDSPQLTAAYTAARQARF
jgi:hypothetical protein